MNQFVPSSLRQDAQIPMDMAAIAKVHPKISAGTTETEIGLAPLPSSLNQAEQDLPENSMDPTR